VGVDDTISKSVARALHRACIRATEEDLHHLVRSLRLLSLSRYADTVRVVVLRSRSSQRRRQIDTLAPASLKALFQAAQCHIFSLVTLNAAIEC